MKLLAMAIPVLPGKTEQLKKFANELKTTRKKEFEDSRKALKIREQTFLQTSPQGDMVILTLKGENPQESFQQLGQKTDEFSKWFQNQAKEIHGIDLTKPIANFPELIAETPRIEEFEHA